MISFLFFPIVTIAAESVCLVLVTEDTETETETETDPTTRRLRINPFIFLTQEFSLSRFDLDHAAASMTPGPPALHTMDL